MVNRPLFTESPTGFADHYEAATTAVARALLDPELAAPSMVWVTAESVGIYPWSRDGRPATDLLAWAEHVAEPCWTVQVCDWGARVKVTGRMYGVPCEIQNNVYRIGSLFGHDLDETDVDVALVREVAARETAQ